MPIWRRNSDANLAAAAMVVDPSNRKLIEKIENARPRDSRADWKFYDRLPEVHYPANFMGYSLSRFDLRIGRRKVEDGQITFAEDKNPLAWSILDALNDGDGISELGRLFGINWTIDADCWLIGRNTSDGTRWQLWSNNQIEFRSDSGESKILVDGEALTRRDYARRIWKRHPADRLRADSALIALKGPCQQLIDLYDGITATLQSRLASAGILFIPSSIQLAGEVSKPNGNGRRTNASLVEQITTMMTQAMNNRNTAAARIPIILKGPSGEGEKIVHITLDRVVTEQEMALRTELRSTLAQGLDMPPEVSEGMGSSNHWSSWSASDSAFRSHIKPTGDVWGDALTEIYLRPMLRAAQKKDATAVSDVDIRELMVLADGSALVVRPNEAEDARELKDRGAISNKSLRSRSGLTEDDKPDDEEYVRWVGEQIGDPYLATYGLDIQSKIDWTKVKVSGKQGPAGVDTPGRPKVNNGNTTAGRPGGGAGGNAGGVKGKGRASDDSDFELDLTMVPTV